MGPNKSTRRRWSSSILLNPVAALLATFGILGAIFVDATPAAASTRNTAVQVINSTRQVLLVDGRGLHYVRLQPTRDVWFRPNLSRVNVYVECDYNHVYDWVYVHFDNPSIGYPNVTVLRKEPVFHTGHEKSYGLSEGEVMPFTVNRVHFVVIRNADDSRGMEHSKVFELNVRSCPEKPAGRLIPFGTTGF